MNGVFLKKGSRSIRSTRRPAPAARPAGRRARLRRHEGRAQDHGPDSNRKILEEIKRYAEEHEQESGRFPKTLIFAVNDLPHTSHADQLVDQARDIFGRGEAFVAKITGRVDRPLQRIREFRNRPNPGRRDRRPADDRRRHPRPGVHRLPAPGQVPHPVRADARPRHPQGREVPGQVPLRRLRLLRRHAAGVLPQHHRHDGRATRRRRQDERQIIEEIWQNRDRDYNTRRLVKRLQRIDKQMCGEARACSLASFRTATRPLRRGPAGPCASRSTT